MGFFKPWQPSEQLRNTFTVGTAGSAGATILYGTLTVGDSTGALRPTNRCCEALAPNLRFRSRISSYLISDEPGQNLEE